MKILFFISVKTEILWFSFLILHKNRDMFSNGQIVFGILFAIAFIIAITYTYRKDLKLHKQHYKGSIWILVAFICFILFIVSIKHFLK